MIDFREIYVLDRNSEFLGVPQSQLMENAGMEVANALSENYDLKNKYVLIVCGTGNNGGDGFVAARYLKERCRIKVVLIKPSKEIRTALARENFEKIVTGGIEVSELPADVNKEARSADIIVDSLLGIGVKKEIKDPYSSIIKKLNGLNKTIVSVDVPSGLGSNLAIKPKMTVTFHDTKEGMNSKNSGKIIVKDRNNLSVPENSLIIQFQKKIHIKETMVEYLS